MFYPHNKLITCFEVIEPTMQYGTRIICFKSYNYYTAPLFYDLTMLDVYKLYRLLIATFVHDLINNKLPHNFIDYFTYVSHHYETRAVKETIILV